MKGSTETQITAQGIEILAKESNWLNLKSLFIGGNEIYDRGLEMLCYGKWPMLEKIYLQSIKITERGIKKMVEISDWPRLKTLDLSGNEKICSEALVAGKWPLLECLSLTL